MIKTLLMHIGDAKCSGTSIQAAIFDAPGAQATEGILHHSTEREGGHNTLELDAIGVIRDVETILQSRFSKRRPQNKDIP